MALGDTKLTVLQVVNEVQRRLMLRPTSTTNDTQHARALVDMLNDVIEEVSDRGEWVQLRGEVDVSCVSGRGVYELPVSGSTESIHHVHEVRVSGRYPPLEWFFDISEYRQRSVLQSYGKPVNAAIVAEDSRGNPTIGFWPRPGANEEGLRATVYFYFKPRKYIAGTDDAEVLALPGRILVHGLHAKALLDESGGAATPHFQTVYAEYMKMVGQALNRFNADTGTTLRIIPGR